jgi:hypothetical protein
MQITITLGIVLVMIVLYFVVIVRRLMRDNDKLHNKLTVTQMKLRSKESELGMTRVLHQISLAVKPSYDETTKIPRM